MRKLHILLVDDQVLFVESLRKVMETIAEDIVVDAVAHDGVEAIAAADRCKPDIVLMDVRMPNMNGVEATAVIRQRLPDTQVIILTTYDDDQYVHDALQAGAVGYLLKDIPPKELASAVRAIGNGAFLISPTIAQRLVRQAREQRHDHEEALARGISIPPWLSQLSRREKEILYFIAHGMSNRQIADALFIAEQTVKNHVSTIYAKIGENDRFRVIEKIRECLEKGYLPPQQDP